MPNSRRKPQPWDVEMTLCIAALCEERQSQTSLADLASYMGRSRVAVAVITR
jgi:hypothetical protein